MGSPKPFGGAERFAHAVGRVTTSGGQDAQPCALGEATRPWAFTSSRFNLFQQPGSAPNRLALQLLARGTTHHADLFTSM